MILFMLVSLGWGILFATDSLEKWHAVILLIVHGLAGVLWAPAGQVLVHDVVGDRQLQSAIRLLATSRTLGLLLGPAGGRRHDYHGRPDNRYFHQRTDLPAADPVADQQPQGSEHRPRRIRRRDEGVP